MPIGKPLKQGFLLKGGREGHFLSGTIKQYGNKEGTAQKAIKGKLHDQGY